jgi:hypothetical protein
MFITVGSKKPYLQSNKKLYEYCKKSSEKSFQRMKIDNLEKNKKIINKLFIQDDLNNSSSNSSSNSSNISSSSSSNNNNNNLFIFLSILSVSSIGYFFYKKYK